MAFPIVRHRRLRQSASMRNLVRETVLTTNDFIYPIYVKYGTNIKEEISSMPGVYRFSLDLLEAEIREIASLGIQSIMLFGLPDHKDAEGTSAYDPNGIVQEATRLIKKWAPELIVMADTCLCQFTDHGHCGMVHLDEVTGAAVVDNDPSLTLLVRTAISQAEAGADVIAPSNMMDGFVSAIREGLDEAGFSHVPILSYSVKYASAFYGPFRDAAKSAPQFGDRKTYQMDPANAREALREADSDVFEGADMLMVKPALSYLDIVRQLRDSFDLPIVAYNVSGEYAMVKAAAANGWIDERAIVLEKLISMKRAGADLIITYHAKDASRWLRGE
ncbi:porphobilinogen synthase [Paenibacillus catalpae]|uniref:Delta-aminolevulinic acid dehydratase n=1 Tax=Paenibacillus catalpae TaxID=1045775 RepID=A0A1I1Z0U9_9BACL|nr:porphobilinogen synthase [Paenibacillus catalpae]SFE23910.1 porphobilinogen synthase [Paenibacillus catalpae]